MREWDSELSQRVSEFMKEAGMGVGPCGSASAPPHPHLNELMDIAFT